jgi:hypothetical protein
VAKKKAKRGRSSGAETQERRRERLDARRRARAETLAAQRRAERRRGLVRTALAALVAVAIGAFLFYQMRPEPTPDTINGHRVESFSETGVNQHVTGTVEYETDPPTHGPHASTPAACGVHAESIPNENMVHALEHGTVGIFYKPSLPRADIRTIESIVRDYDGRVLSAPYEGMPSDIAVVSWGEMMRLNALDERAMRAYIAAFRGRGPEDVPCPSTSDSPFGGGN